MNWKKGLGLFVMLAALTGALWLSRSSLDPRRHAATNVSTISAAPERLTKSDEARPRRPWDDIKPRGIAGPPPFRPKPAPQDLQVEWQGGWYAAEILSSNGSSNLIRYKGYGPEWDEWVSSERMRFVPPGTVPAETVLSGGDGVFQSGGAIFRPTTTPAQPTNEPFVHGSPGKDDLLVQWGSGWWPAEVLESQGTNYLIRYKGYGAEWDEWITAQRMGIYEGDKP